MTSSAGISLRHANAYQHNNSLLFQFILVEFIETFGEIQRLDILCNRKPAALPADNGNSLHNETTCRQIEEVLAKLVGSARDYMRLFSWNFGDGLLTKLKNNCALFLHNADNDEKEMIALQHYADKMWLGCLQAIDSWREEPREQAAFLAAIDKASNAMQRFSKLIARIALQFRDDENVIFCILSHKESLDKLYGTRFISKLLCRMYPKGLREAQLFLSKRYAERGFDNILPAIAFKIAELEVSAL